jgi:predicted RNase H-like nuclease (RuvC/YqgF family)
LPILGPTVAALLGWGSGAVAAPILLGADVASEAAGVTGKMMTSAGTGTAKLLHHALDTIKTNSDAATIEAEIKSLEGKIADYENQLKEKDEQIKKLEEKNRELSFGEKGLLEKAGTGATKLLYTVWGATDARYSQEEIDRLKKELEKKQELREKNERIKDLEKKLDSTLVTQVEVAPAYKE